MSPERFIFFTLATIVITYSVIKFLKYRRRILMLLFGVILLIYAFILKLLISPYLLIRNIYYSSEKNCEKKIIQLYDYCLYESPNVQETTEVSKIIFSIAKRISKIKQSQQSKKRLVII
jgi:hypothetical protein